MNSDNALNIVDTVIVENSAADGGGIFTNGEGGAVTISNSAIDRNTASGQGGGLVANYDYGKVTITGSSFTQNSAMDGGAIYFGDGIPHNQLHVTNSLIAGNSATRDGGGILEYADTFIVSSTLAQNKAGGNGGGINASTRVRSNGTVVQNSFVVQNTAAGAGGGIWDFGTLENPDSLSGTVISGNTPGNCLETGSVTIVGCN
jgi:predicted outer membrane repeat protein